MVVNMHFLVFTHLIEINSADELGFHHHHVSMLNMSMINSTKYRFDDVSINNFIVPGLNKTNDKLLRKLRKNESHETSTFVCFCSENAAYYNYLIYYFPW